MSQPTDTYGTLNLEDGVANYISLGFKIADPSGISRRRANLPVVPSRAEIICANPDAASIKTYLRESFFRRIERLDVDAAASQLEPWFSRDWEPFPPAFDPRRMNVPRPPTIEGVPLCDLHWVDPLDFDVTAELEIAWEHSEPIHASLRIVSLDSLNKAASNANGFAVLSHGSTFLLSLFDLDAATEAIRELAYKCQASSLDLTRRYLSRFFSFT
ncbi:MAG: hypothetical protein AAGN82_17180 [Myxococcota bacterium]